jgi:hypothetical protein
MPGRPSPGVEGEGALSASKELEPMHSSSGGHLWRGITLPQNGPQKQGLLTFLLTAPLLLPN